MKEEQTPAPKAFVEKKDVFSSLSEWRGSRLIAVCNSSGNARLHKLPVANLEQNAQSPACA